MKKASVLLCMSLTRLFTAVCPQTSYIFGFVFLETNQQIVKGLTHCLLPGCSNPTWPFENYCGRTHANIGKQRGLIRTSVPCVYPRSPDSTSPHGREKECNFIHCFALIYSRLLSLSLSSLALSGHQCSTAAQGQLPVYFPKLHSSQVCGGCYHPPLLWPDTRRAGQEAGHCP